MAFTTSDRTTSPGDADSPIGKGWVQGVALVMIFGFFVMGILTYRTYTASMPLPDKVEETKLHLLNEEGGQRLLKVLIRGENVAHVF